ncbi:hypothetical protein H109_02738 [Trichophyton interdigitale MR816]|uniref:Uncharacterized protein n=1 Tax=Trichophyton interdigitale (strain MR816) TaxID=1215338 RepID=A0A059JC57_TRIIM|nr:hypothetical protein H101_05166 [Trichophyton interdigitale H6]KDB25445.1 hypothetical protein H109_02738 [Trichophyton interdigitale MR816]
MTYIGSSNAVIRTSTHPELRFALETASRLPRATSGAREATMRSFVSRGTLRWIRSFTVENLWPLARGMGWKHGLPAGQTEQQLRPRPLLALLRGSPASRSRPRSQQRAQWPAGADGADGADGTDSPPGTLQQQQQQQRANKPLLAVPVLTV